MKFDQSFPNAPLFPLPISLFLTRKLVGEQPEVHRCRLAVAEIVRRGARRERERRWRSRRR